MQVIAQGSRTISNDSQQLHALLLKGRQPTTLSFSLRLFEECQIFTHTNKYSEIKEFLTSSYIVPCYLQTGGACHRKFFHDQLGTYSVRIPCGHALGLHFEVRTSPSHLIITYSSSNPLNAESKQPTPIPCLKDTIYIPITHTIFSFESLIDLVTCLPVYIMLCRPNLIGGGAESDVSAGQWFYAVTMANVGSPQR